MLGEVNETLKISVLGLEYIYVCQIRAAEYLQKQRGCLCSGSLSGILVVEETFYFLICSMLLASGTSRGRVNGLR